MLPVSIGLGLAGAAMTVVAFLYWTRHLFPWHTAPIPPLCNGRFLAIADKVTIKGGLLPASEGHCVLS